MFLFYHNFQFSKDFLFTCLFFKSSGQVIYDKEGAVLGKVVFVEYNGEDRCNRCYLSRFSEDICLKACCLPKERKDHKKGYFVYRGHVVTEYKF